MCALAGRGTSLVHVPFLSYPNGLSRRTLPSVRPNVRGVAGSTGSWVMYPWFKRHGLLTMPPQGFHEVQVRETSHPQKYKSKLLQALPPLNSDFRTCEISSLAESRA